MSRIELKVNGRPHTLDVEPDTPLLYILRNDLDLRGPASAADSDNAVHAR